MDLDDIRNRLSLQAIGEKVFKIKSMYYPNLIVNLSKESHDLYLIRNSIYDLLLELLNEKDIDIPKVKNFIKNKIEENKKQLKEVENEIEAERINMLIEEWKQFL